MGVVVRPVPGVRSPDDLVVALDETEDTVLGMLTLVEESVEVMVGTSRVVSSTVELTTVLELEPDTSEVLVLVTKVLLSSDGLVDLETSVTGEVVGITGKLEVVSRVTSDDFVVFFEEDSVTNVFEESRPISTLELDSDLADDPVPDELIVDGTDALEVVTTTGEEVLDVVV